MGEEVIIPQWASRSPLSRLNHTFIDPSLNVDPVSIEASRRISPEYLREQNELGFTNYYQGLFKDYNRLAKLNNGITSALGAANGISGVINANQQLSNINVPTYFNIGLNDVRSFGSRNYDTQHQLAHTMSRGINVAPLTYQNVYGKNGWQEAAGAGSSMISGAMAGGAVGGLFGPIGKIGGTILGGAAGLLTGIGSIQQGRRNARTLAAFGNSQLDVASNEAGYTFSSENERLAKKKFEEGVSNVAARGGSINTARKQESIYEFRDRIFGKPTSIHPSREYCKGGVKVKIKR